LKIPVVVLHLKRRLWFLALGCASEFKPGPVASGRKKGFWAAQGISPAIPPHREERLQLLRQGFVSGHAFRRAETSVV